MSEFGSGFITGEQLLLITFKRKDGQTPLCNFRVDNLSSIICTLKENNIKIVSDIESYKYGDFATFEDPFGNVIELWEANSIEYRAMVKKEITDYNHKKNTNN